MSGRLKRRIVIAAVVLGVVGLGGTALATSSSGGNPFLNDVAHRLGIAPAKLQSAVNGAITDRLNQLVKQGTLTRAQANAIEQRMKQHGGALPFAGPFGGPFGGGAFHRHFRGGPRPAFGFGGPLGSLQTAATYLGVSPATLVKDLRSGKTLAAVAKANGKSVSGLEAALLALAPRSISPTAVYRRAPDQGAGAPLPEPCSRAASTDFVTEGFHFAVRRPDAPRLGRRSRRRHDERQERRSHRLLGRPAGRSRSPHRRRPGCRRPTPASPGSRAGGPRPTPSPRPRSARRLRAAPAR